MDKLKMHTPNLADENFKKLAEMFPNAVTETITGYEEDGKPIIERAIDTDVLRQEISARVVEGAQERYQFTWPDKKKSVVLANAPIAKTLRLDREKSVGRDGIERSIDSENIYIEGDNLDALKLLQETYLGKVKMIYIDPPYNTGNDFIYEDDFSQDTDEYFANSGQFDEESNQLVQNTESNGRFHTDWLNMLYPRLRIAKDLLSDDGVIFISIDDNEQDNLKKICDEIFGTQNFIANLVWDLGTGTTAGHFTRGHENIICFSRNKKCLNNFKNYNDGEKITHGALKKISYKNPAVEITFPAGFEFEGCNAVFSGELGDSEKEYILSDEMRFENGKLVKPTIIRAGFAMKNQIEAYIAGKEVLDTKGQRVLKFYFNNNGILFYEKEKSIVNPRTVLSNIANTKNGSSELMKLFGNKYFDFPKPTLLINYLLKLVTDENAIVMDFFSGSATTAHAVMQLNAEDGGNRKFIMVQLPEETDEKSEAYKAGYKNICEIGEERIRRAGKKIKEETGADIDYGFRVFRVDSSNMKDVYYRPAEYTQEQLSLYADNIKPDRTPEDLLFQVVLDLGVLLSSKIDEEEIAGKKVFSVENGYLIACFDNNVTEDTVTEIAKRHPFYAVFRDSGLASDSVAVNFEQIFETYSPKTRRKVL